MHREPSETTSVDLLRQWQKDPQFWSRAALINQRLAAYTSQSAETVAGKCNPADLVRQFNQLHFDPRYLEEEVTATIADAEYSGLTQVQGTLLSFSDDTFIKPEQIGDQTVPIAQRALALVIGDQTIPLSKERLLQLEVAAAAYQPDSTPFDYLAEQIETISQLTARPAYQQAAPEDRQALLQYALDDVNNYLDIIANDDSVSIIRLHSRSAEHTPRTILAQYIAVTMAHHTATPCFEIVDLHETVHQVPCRQIDDIELTHIAVSEYLMTDDVVALLDNEQARAAIKLIENNMRYNNIDSTAELIELLGPNFCQGGLFSGHGTIYQADNDQLTSTVSSFYRLKGEQFELVMIDGTWRVALALSDPRGESRLANTHKLYVIPDKQHMSHCVRHDIDDENWQDGVHSIAL